MSRTPTVKFYRQGEDGGEGDDEAQLFRGGQYWAAKFATPAVPSTLMPLSPPRDLNLQCRLMVPWRRAVGAVLFSQLMRWLKQGHHGGRVISPSPHDAGSYRPPDLGYLSRDTCKLLNSMRTPRDRPPFQLVIEIDILSGSDSRLEVLDASMRSYMADGVQIGWLIDPVHRQVHEYRRNLRNGGAIVCDADKSWRDLDGGEALPGFHVPVGLLDMALARDGGGNVDSDGENEFEEGDEDEYLCQVPECVEILSSLQKYIWHLDEHVQQRAVDRFYATQHDKMGIPNREPLD